MTTQEAPPIHTDRGTGHYVSDDSPHRLILAVARCGDEERDGIANAIPCTEYQERQEQLACEFAKSLEIDGVSFYRWLSEEVSSHPRNIPVFNGSKGAVVGLLRTVLIENKARRQLQLSERNKRQAQD
jgi:hypothetical protein